MLTSGDARSADVATARGTTGPRLEAESVVERRWPPLRRRDAGCGCCCRFAGEEAAGRARNASAHRSAAAALAAALNPDMARESQPLGHLLIPTLQRISAAVARLAHSLPTHTRRNQKKKKDEADIIARKRTSGMQARTRTARIKPAHARTETVTEYQEATDTISKMKPRRTHDGSERAKRGGGEKKRMGRRRERRSAGCGGGGWSGRRNGRGRGGRSAQRLVARSPLSSVPFPKNAHSPASAWVDATRRDL